MSPVPTFTGMGPNPSFEDIVKKVNTLVMELRNLMLHMDSVNMFEVGGWLVTHDQLASKDGDVGMSTVDTGGDDIRFWAGDVKTGTPKFKVTKAGIATLISMIIQSVAAGERIVIDGTGFHAYDASGVERITIGTSPAKGAKALITRNAAGVVQGVYTYDTETVDSASRTGQFITAHGAYVLLGSDGDVRIQNAGGGGFRVIALNRPQIGIAGSWFNIAIVGDSTSSHVQGNHNHGIPNGTKLATTADGVTVNGFVTFVESGGFSHTHTIA